MVERDGARVWDPCDVWWMASTRTKGLIRLEILGVVLRKRSVAPRTCALWLGTEFLMCGHYAPLLGQSPVAASSWGHITEVSRCTMLLRSALWLKPASTYQHPSTGVLSF